MPTIKSRRLDTVVMFFWKLFEICHHQTSPSDIPPSSPLSSWVVVFLQTCSLHSSALPTPRLPVRFSCSHRCYIHTHQRVTPPPHPPSPGCTCAPGFGRGTRLGLPLWNPWNVGAVRYATRSTEDSSQMQERLWKMASLFGLFLQDCWLLLRVTRVVQNLGRFGAERVEGMESRRCKRSGRGRELGSGRLTLESSQLSSRVAAGRCSGWENDVSALMKELREEKAWKLPPPPIGVTSGPLQPPTPCFKVWPHEWLYC